VEQQKMKYDAVIVGGGPGGYEAALWVSRLGGKAVLAERGELGGVCTNRGCIPTKALAASLAAYESILRAGEFGVDVPSSKLNMEGVFRRRDRVSVTLRKGVEKQLADAGVEAVKGEGRIVSSSKVQVGDKTLEGRAIVVATGSEPSGLPGIGIDHDFVISGDDAAAISTLPANLVIVGGGFIGCEYASIFSGLGSRVTLIEALPDILPLEDSDVSAALEKSLSGKVRILKGVRVESADGRTKSVKAAGESIPADKVLLAVGRRPVLPAGLAEAGVRCDRQGVAVDSTMRTSVKGIYAVGDAVNGLKLAHVAYAGAQVAARNIMGERCEADFSDVPWCVFTSPEIARVGITEREAKGRIMVGRSDYLSNGKARCLGERGGFCKVIAEEGSGVILGVHIVGAHASDLIGEAAVAVGKRLTLADVTGTIHPHPTLTEIFKEACQKASA
jgi:dihydrolipoamide dehydrogenase